MRNREVVSRQLPRAHYRAGEILIVDEPTAALDARAEERTFGKIRALADQGQTILLITHRMASVQHADLVHVLHEGHVIESGSPADLLADPHGHYRALYDIQAAQFTHHPTSTVLPHPHPHQRHPAADHTPP